MRQVLLCVTLTFHAPPLHASSTLRTMTSKSDLQMGLILRPDPLPQLFNPALAALALVLSIVVPCRPREIAKKSSLPRPHAAVMVPPPSAPTANGAPKALRHSTPLSPHDMPRWLRLSSINILVLKALSALRSAPPNSRPPLPTGTSLSWRQKEIGQLQTVSHLRLPQSLELQLPLGQVLQLQLPRLPLLQQSEEYLP